MEKAVDLQTGLKTLEPFDSVSTSESIVGPS